MQQHPNILYDLLACYPHVNDVRGCSLRRDLASWVNSGAELSAQICDVISLCLHYLEQPHCRFVTAILFITKCRVSLPLGGKEGAARNVCSRYLHSTPQVFTVYPMCPTLLYTLYAFARAFLLLHLPILPNLLMMPLLALLALLALLPQLPLLPLFLLLPFLLLLFAIPITQL